MSEYSSARDFFVSLTWNAPIDMLTPVFLPREIETLPLKWLKYLLLERVGFTTTQQLEHTIHRFAPSNLNAARERCYSLLASPKYSTYRSLIIVKVVFFDQAGQLPNFRITAPNDIEVIFESRLQPFLHKAHEVWLCESDIAESGVNFGGRLAYSLGDLYQNSLIEIVWYSSPRRIEEYKSKRFHFPYLRAHNVPGTSQYVIDTLDIPPKYQIMARREQELIADYHWVLQSIYRHRESQQRLEAILHRANARELSLEFKASNGRFSIIDWDTEVETAL